VDHVDANQYEGLASARGKEVGVTIDAETFAITFNLIRAANVLVAKLEQDVYRSRGVSYAGFRVMFALWVVGPTEPKQLAHLANVTRSSTSSVLNTLERDGLVERRRESADRRLVTAALTERGADLVHETFDKHHALETKWVSVLSATERKQAANVLRLLVTRGQ
jgi:DNA-binding MarR family transcriptional regulator